VTTTEAATAATDEEVGGFADTMFGMALGTLELTVIWLGRELGLYAALREMPNGATAPELAATTAIDSRYAREWLEHQAVAGIVTVDDPSATADERRFTLPEAHAVVLLDEEHPAYSGALADVAPILARSLELLPPAFRSGAGIKFAEYGLHDMQAGFTRPMFKASLVDEWLPGLTDVHARLQAGESLRIADFGCGEGWALIYIAEAYPNVTVHGFDLDDSSIAAARRNAAERGVADRARFEVKDARDKSLEDYDLVFSCEVIHDLADPVGVLSSMRRVTGEHGTVLIIDERTAEQFSPSGDPIERLLYAFSIIHCLPVGRAASESAATGTVMRPDTFTSYATQAGFTSVEVLPIEHPLFRLYRLHH
jgi:ubiquinone/menaquinone biosynthesis C-methylase UbiE